MIVDGHIQFYGMDKKHEYSGQVAYRDSSGKKFKHRFIIDAEMFRGTPYHSEETLLTHHELQKLPKEIQKLCQEVSGIKEILSERVREGNQS